MYYKNARLVVVNATLSYDKYYDRYSEYYDIYVKNDKKIICHTSL